MFIDLFLEGQNGVEGRISFLYNHCHNWWKLKFSQCFHYFTKTTVYILSTGGAFLKDRILEMRLLSQKTNLDQNCSPETGSHTQFFAFESCWGCCIIDSLLLISAATLSFLSHSSHWMSPFFSYHLYMLIWKHVYKTTLIQWKHSVLENN